MQRFPDHKRNIARPAKMKSMELSPGKSLKNNDYAGHLSKDSRMKKIIGQQGRLVLTRHDNICLRLCAAIISQQLSTRVAGVIYQRFLDFFDGKSPQPQDILAISTERLRGIGLSGAKAEYLHHVARFARDKGMDHARFSGMDAGEIVDYLTQIKGVGRWTVEMILMFTLGHEDIFAADDLGIRQAMIRLYRLDDSDKKKFRQRILEISSRWRPYRTYACLHLWRWKDSKGNPAPKKSVKTK